MERLKVDSIELQIRKAEIGDLTNINNSHLITIANLRTQITTYDAKELNYKNQITLLEKEVKKWKRKNKWTAVGGLVLSGVIAGLFIFK